MTEVNSSDALSEIKYERNKARLMQIFDLYRANPSKHESDFWSAITEFANTKLYYIEMEFPQVGTSGTVDDYAQEVVMGVWKLLPEFNGDSEKFYAWVHSICFKHAADFFNELRHQKDNKTGVTVVVEDENGWEEEVDNAELHKGEYNFPLIQLPSDLTNEESHLVSAILTGKRVQNKDKNHPYLNVGDWMTRARTDQEIADELGVPLNTLKSKIKRLRDRVRRKSKSAT